MDKYKEQLVQKGKDPADTAKRLFVTAAGIILATLLVFLSMRIIGNILVGVVLAGVVLWGTYYILGGFYTEYEYIFTNGEMDIDKIMGQRKRKRLVTVDLKSTLAFGKAETADDSQDMTVIDVSDRECNDNFYIDFRHSQLGRTRLILSLNDDMYNLIEGSVPRIAKRT